MSEILFKAKIHNIKICVENIIELLRFAMEVVEVTELKGDEQKVLAISLVRKVIVEAPVSDEKEKLMLDVIDQGILGNTVDLIICASKGNLDINKLVTVTKKCCFL